MLGRVRPVETNFAAGQHGEKNPIGERRFAETAGGDDREAQPADQREGGMRAEDKRQDHAYGKETEAQQDEPPLQVIAGFSFETVEWWRAHQISNPGLEPHRGIGADRAR